MPAIVFDFLGTLVLFDDVINVIWETWQTKGLAHHQNAVALFNDWYYASTLDYVAASHSGLYRSFAKVLRGTMARSIYKTLGILPLEEDINRVVETFKNSLLPAQDSLDALQTALAHGWTVWIITHGDELETWNYLEKHGMVKNEHGDKPITSGPVFVMSCDKLKVAKPNPQVYAQVMRATIRYTQKIENFYMVSSSSRDLEGAKNVSMRTVFLANQEMIYPASVYDRDGPDLQGDSLVECVEKVLAFEQSLNLHYL